MELWKGSPVIPRWKNLCSLFEFSPVSSSTAIFVPPTWILARGGVGGGGGRMELACEMVYVLSAYPMDLSIEVFKFNFFSKAPSSARRFYIFFKLWAVPLVDFIWFLQLTFQYSLCQAFGRCRRPKTERAQAAKKRACVPFSLVLTRFSAFFFVEPFSPPSWSLD